jgi:HSP20 family protein
VSVLVDIPGCEEDDIRIRAENGTLTVLATRREEADEEATIYLQERPHKFERTVDLPAEADIEGASAEYETGVCTIELPKTEGQKRREIGFQ